MGPSEIKKKRRRKKKGGGGAAGLPREAEAAAGGGAVEGAGAAAGGAGAAAEAEGLTCELAGEIVECGEFGFILAEAIEGLPAEMREGAVASRAAVLRALTEMQLADADKMYTALTMERAPLESLLARRGVQGCSQLLSSLQQARSSCALSSSLFAHRAPCPIRVLLPLTSTLGARSFQRPLLSAPPPSPPLPSTPSLSPSLSPGAGEAPLQLTQAARGSRCVECSTRGGEGHTLSSA